MSWECCRRGFLCGKVRLAVLFRGSNLGIADFCCGSVCSAQSEGSRAVGYVQFAVAVGGVDDSERLRGGDFDTEGVDERLTEITCGH